MKDVKLLRPGQRVRVADDHHWAQRASGTIVDPGDEIKGIAAGWDGPGRVVDATDGDIRFLWIEFDEPQFDADGDGPYSSAEVDARFVIYAD